MKVVSNFIYSIIYQIMMIILPLIFIPYTARIFGAEGVGINAYTMTIVQYFVLLGTLGIQLYGNRSIAYVRDNKEKLKKTFWEIYLLQITTSFIALIIYFIAFVLRHSEYSYLYAVQGILILSAGIDISWFFMGIEDFKKTVTRNAIVKILGVILVLTLVKTKDQLWLYMLISALTTFLGQLTMWFYVNQYIGFCKVNLKQILSHFVPNLYLFIPQIAVQVYMVISKTMLGYMTNKIELAYFENSDKIIRMTLALVTASGAVLLPRVANEFAKGNSEKVHEYIYKSFNISTYLTIPIVFGLIGISNTFVPWFLGNEFLKCKFIIVIISPIVLLAGLNGVIGMQYLLPTNRIKEYTTCLVMGATFNIILNLILIKYLASIGVAISAVLTELLIMIAQLYVVKKEFDIKLLFGELWRYILSGTIMLFILKFMEVNITFSTFLIIEQVFVGITVYIGMLFLLKSKVNQYVFSIIIRNGFKKLDVKINT